MVHALPLQHKQPHLLPVHVIVQRLKDCLTPADDVAVWPVVKLKLHQPLWRKEAVEGTRPLTLVQHRALRLQLQDLC